MKIQSNEETLEITADYESGAEWRKLAKQKRVRLSIKALEKGGQCSVQWNEEKRQLYIKCNNKQIFEHILKGFQSVAQL